MRLNLGHCPLGVGEAVKKPGNPEGQAPERTCAGEVVHSAGNAPCQVGVLAIAKHNMLVAS